jgi:signal transduction histidine kinase/CheY-like chemotaxis protein/HPt (histidine-containing phosphotransfer) domain-containing protein
MSLNEHFFESLLAQLPGDFVVFDMEFRYVYVNPKAVQDPEIRKWIIGKTDLEYCEYRNVPKEIAERRREMLTTVLSTKQEVEIEESLIDKEGNTRYYIRRVKPYLDNDGNFTHFLGYGVEITEQKVVREALLTSESLLNKAQQLAKVGSYEYDFIVDKITWTVGTNEIWKRPIELGAPTYDEFIKTIHPEDVEMVKSNSENIFKYKKPFDSSYRIICPDGEVKMVKTFTQLKFDSNGNLVGLLGSLIDITEQKKSEDELIEAKQLAEESVMIKEKFMANLGHEMRTPLNGVLGMSRLLQKTQLSQTQKKYINVLNSTAENLLVIINDLLDIAKIESGTLSFDKVVFDINQVADTAVQIKLLVAEEKGLMLKHILSSNSSIKVISDPYRVNQVLLNLIGNAIKFTNEGEIVVSQTIIKQSEDKIWVQFSVKDTGIGIEENQYSKIFNSFTQINPNNQKVTEGVGLGLSIVKSIVAQMGGEIKVESIVGKGSEFFVILPFELSIGEEQEKAEASERLMMTSLRVLLAEDNLVNQFILQAMLQDWGFNVDVAENGEDAFILFKNNNYEIVLMDIQMPVLDGLATTDLIRNYHDEKKSKVPIIALTANPSRQFQKKFLNAGMNDVVVKPFKEDLLYKKIVSLCSGNIDLIKVVKRKFPARKKPVAISSKLYNLSFLEKEIGTNNDFMQKMLEIFIDTIPESVSRMNEHFKHSEMDAVATLAHKIKPTIDGAGITTLYQTIRNVEKYRELKRTPIQLKNDLTKIESTINTIVDDFKTEIEGIKSNRVNLN